MTLPWLLVCATKPEWGELKKICSFSLDNSIESVRLMKGIHQSTPFYLSQMGLGPQKAGDHAHQITTHLKSKITGVIHFGVSGALIEDLETGKIILPDVIINDKKEVTGSTPALLKKCQQIFLQNKIAFRKEDLFTSSTILETPQQKKTAGRQYDAAIVDMESYPYAKIISESGLPYLSIRCVWDPVDWDLSALESSLTNEGEVSAKGVLGSVLKNPKLILSLPRYQSATSKCSKSLAYTLSCLLPLVSSGKY